jgi:hypothetical protein
MRPLFLASRSFLFFFFPFLLAAFLSTPAYSQSPDHATDRIVWLSNGDTIYTHQLEFRLSPTGDKYLLLDNGKELPLELVSRFQGRRGIFVVMSGSAGPDVYKVIKEGPRISAYSRTLYEAPLDSFGAHPVAFYYRKAGQSQMNLMTYNGLLNAMDDNPAALHEVQSIRTQFVGGMILTVVSAGIMGYGLYKSFKKNSSQQLALPTLTANPPINPFGPPTPPTLPPLPKASVSPLVFVGLGGIGAGLIIGLGAHRHELRAFDLYNDMGTPYRPYTPNTP